MSRESLRPGCRWPGAWTKCCCSLVACRTPTLDFSRRGPTGELSWREMGLGIRMYTVYPQNTQDILYQRVLWLYRIIGYIYIYIKVTDWGLILTTWLNQRSFSNGIVAPCYLKMAMSDLEDNEHQWLWNGLVWFIIIFLVASGSILFLEYPLLHFPKTDPLCTYIYMYIFVQRWTHYIFLMVQEAVLGLGRAAAYPTRRESCRMPGGAEAVWYFAPRHRWAKILYIHYVVYMYIYKYSVCIYIYYRNAVYIYNILMVCVYAESPPKIWQRSSQPLWNWCSWPVTSILRSACLGIQVSIRAPGFGHGKLENQV